MKLKDKWKRGLPYIGNKGQKVEQIMEALPDGKRFVDVFGGGGCVSLTAASSGKYEEVIYNDRRNTVVNLLKALIEDNPHFDLMKYVYMDRETFNNWRDNMPDSIERTLVLTAWSFGNELLYYMWGKKIEKEKLQLNRAIFFGDTGTKLDELYEYAKNEATIYGKYQMFHKWRLEKMKISSHWDGLERFRQLESIAQLQQLERLQQLDKMDQLQKIEFLTLDYRSLEIGPEDVVYCDPPYVGTSKDYGGFDSKAFENWYLYECPAKEIYISEYTKLPHTEVALNLGKKLSFTLKGERRDELLLKYVK